MVQTSDEKNWFEWTVFAIGLVLTLGTVGVLLYELAAQGQQKPPAIKVRLGNAEKRTGHYAVPVTVENSGDETAETVQIEATLVPPEGAKEEKATFQIQFLPGHGTRRGWVTFSSNPNSGILRARPVGYGKP